MNRLEPVDESERRWRLPRHAHIVVYDRDGRDCEDRDRGLLTVYDCGATHRSPSATLLGTLESVDAPAELESTPTGRVVRLRGDATLEEPDPNRYRIRRG